MSSPGLRTAFLFPPTGTHATAMDDWRYEKARDLDQTLVERLRGCPREPDMLVYGIRSLAALGLRTWLRIYHRIEVVGRQHLPAEGSYVLIANHTSHLDTLILLSVLPLRKLHRAFPAAAADYFFTSVPRLALTALLVNALPFDRKIHIRQSLGLCRELLANPGNILILFPEGTRSTTGEMGEFKPGIGILLGGTDVPVLPCHIAGAFEAWPKGSMLPRPARLRVSIGSPRVYAARQPGKECALEICRELREAVLEVGGVDRRKPGCTETPH